MSEEERFLDFATVRNMLNDANARRGFLTYEQKAALQHAEWAASENRSGYSTDPNVFNDMFNAIMEIEYPIKPITAIFLLPKLSDALPQDALVMAQATAEIAKIVDVCISDKPRSLASGGTSTKAND